MSDQADVPTGSSDGRRPPRRRRSRSAAPPDQSRGAGAEVARAQSAPTATERRADHGDRQWRELAGSGRSQLSLDAALRARNADQPTAADVREAEQNTVVQHRNWVPTNPG